MRNRASRQIGGLVAVVVLVIALGAVGRVGWLRSVFGYVTTPISHDLRGVSSGIGSTFTTVTQARHLAADNAHLEAQMASLRQQISNDAEIRQENAALKRQLQFNQAPSAKLIPAEVIAYEPDNFRQFLTIGRGHNDGIATGMAVEADGVLVGQIQSTSATTAEVFLVTDPDFRINGLDQTTRATGTVQGQLGNGLAMTKIAQSDQVSPGDTIITSGLGGAITKGIIIGRIGSVDQSDNQVFQTAQISSDLKISKLELVFVVASAR